MLIKSKLTHYFTSAWKITMQVHEFPLKRWQKSKSSKKLGNLPKVRLNFLNLLYIYFFYFKYSLKITQTQIWAVTLCGILCLIYTFTFVALRFVWSHSSVQRSGHQIQFWSEYCLTSSDRVEINLWERNHPFCMSRMLLRNGWCHGILLFFFLFKVKSSWKNLRLYCTPKNSSCCP